MVSAATYNRNAFGRIWNLSDLPREWPGYSLLLRGNQDNGPALASEALDRIDWLAFSGAVANFQDQENLLPRDAKLGPMTLQRLREFYAMTPAGGEILTRLGDLVFRRAAVPVSPPPGPKLTGRSSAEKAICNLWNSYGAAIYQQARTFSLPVDAALAVFWVESNQAYDPRSGLVIIRFEPAVFRRKSGQSVSYSRGGQQDEWRNLARAHAVAAEAALLSTSYGLPQLMGFNWHVTRHPSLPAMIIAFQNSCVEQVAGFFAFVAQNGLVRPILQGDWRSFTRGYNGPGNVEEYSGKLIRALRVIYSLREGGARFGA
jgi:hypothetical protein